MEDLQLRTETRKNSGCLMSHRMLRCFDTHGFGHRSGRRCGPNGAHCGQQSNVFHAPIQPVQDSELQRRLCEDGDQAVDEYIRLDPELVVLSLDIPSLDGHLAALEMREHGGEQRIVFVAPSRMAELATNASYSAGAVAWLQSRSPERALKRSGQPFSDPSPTHRGSMTSTNSIPIAFKSRRGHRAAGDA